MLLENKRRGDTGRADFGSEAGEQASMRVLVVEDDVETANFIAKVAIHRRTCVTPPSPPRDDTWSTLAAPDAE